MDRGKMQSDLEKLTHQTTTQTKEVETLRDTIRIKEHQFTGSYRNPSYS